MKLAQRIISGSALNLLDHGVKCASMLILTPVIISHLGLTVYGIWLLLTAAVSFLNLLDGGITLSGTRFLAKSLGKKVPGSEPGTVIATLRWLYRWIGLICLVTTLGITGALPLFLKEAEWLETGRMVVLAMGVTTAFRFFLRIHTVVLKSHLRYDLIVVTSIAKVIVQTIILLVLLHLEQGLTALVTGQIVSDILDQLLLRRFSRRVNEHQGSGPGYSRELSREILRFSSHTLLNTAGQHLRSRVDPFLVNAFVGLASVSVYNMGLRLATLFADLVIAIMGGSLLAGFSYLEGRDGFESVRRKYFLSLRVSIPFALMGACGLAALGPPFLIRWLGPEFADSGRVLEFLILPYTLWLMQFPSGSLLLSLNQHHHLTKLTFAAGLVNVILSTILASIIGFFGVVLATLIEMSLFYGIAVPILVSKVLQISLRDYYLAMIRPILKIGWLVPILIYLGRRYSEPDYLSLFWIGTLMAATFAAASAYFLTSSSERNQLLSRIRTRFRK